MTNLTQVSDQPFLVVDGDRVVSMRLVKDRTVSASDFVANLQTNEVVIPELPLGTYGYKRADDTESWLVAQKPQKVATSYFCNYEDESGVLNLYYPWTVYRYDWHLSSERPRVSLMFVNKNPMAEDAVFSRPWLTNHDERGVMCLDYAVTAFQGNGSRAKKIMDSITEIKSSQFNNDYLCYANDVSPFEETSSVQQLFTEWAEVSRAAEPNAAYVMCQKVTKSLDRPEL